MKKKNYLLMFLCICPMVGFGQLKVQSNGTVVVNPTSTLVTGTQLTVNSTGNKGIYVYRSNTNTASAIGLESLC